MEEELGPIKSVKSEKMYKIYYDDMVVFTHGGALVEAKHEDLE